MGTIICRVAFCIECFNRNRPRTDQLFLTYGTTRNEFIVKAAERIGTRGYTPHILELEKCDHDNGQIIYRCTCGMNGCDTSIFSGGGKFTFKIHKRERALISLKQWNSWVQYKGDPQYQV